MRTIAKQDEPLHLIDLAGEIDPLAVLVMREQDVVMARDLSLASQRWRTSLELMWRGHDAVIAWGGRAFRTARRGAVSEGVYRPAGHEAVEPPIEGWLAAAWTDDQRVRLIAAGWPQADVAVVRPPGIDAHAPAQPIVRQVSREALGIGQEEFVWLLSGDSCRTGGLREAIWAGTLMHVMERDRRRHRILVWGDGLVHRRARRFVDQLGLPMLYATADRCAYHALAEIADAAVLLPTGPSGAWSAAVVARAGLPAVINLDAEVQEALGGHANVRTAPAGEPRFVVREMLRLSESLPPRLPGGGRFAPEAVNAQWKEVFEGAISAASAGGT